jgi:glycosyltransferase involved in cell wall biosynthesis
MSADRFFVSVVIAVLNGERYLTAALDSVLAQTYKASEIIVVDGKSSDNTEKIANAYPQVRYLRQAGRGWGDAVNTGIDVAQGELLAFLSHDDLWLPNKLSRQVDCFAREPETQYTVTLFKYFLEPGFALPPGFKPELLGKSLIGKTMETLVARRQLFDRIGKLNTDFSLANEVDWFARAKDHAVRMAVIPEVLMLKRLHDTNLTYTSLVNSELLELLKQSIMRQRQQQRHPPKTDERERV